MHISLGGIAALKELEGLRLTAYQDSAGVWTIGWGHTRGVRPGDKITEEKAHDFLVDDLLEVQRCIATHVKIDLKQGQYDALASFVFNLGCTKFRSSTLLAKLNAGDHRGAADEFLRWTYAGGRTLTGLLRRRHAERRMFMEVVL